MTRRTYPGPGEDYARPSYEDAPLSRNEYIQALVHLYRGEVHRATLWRLRLDNTTNWSIISVMGLVTFSLSERGHSHVGILAGMALVFTFLSIEARRFRFFDVWRARSRMLEENFFGPILRRDLKSPVSSWGQLVAEDLLHPNFHITFHQALRARLTRNYIPLFSLLVVCWVLKLYMDANAIGNGFTLLDAMEIGGIPWWLSMGAVALLYGYLLAIVLFVSRAASPEEAYWGRRDTQEPVSSIDV
jgi:uncharacterized membrane protein